MVLHCGNTVGLVGVVHIIHVNVDSTKSSLRLSQIFFFLSHCANRRAGVDLGYESTSFKSCMPTLCK